MADTLKICEVSLAEIFTFELSISTNGVGMSWVFSIKIDFVIFSDVIIKFVEEIITSILVIYQHFKEVHYVISERNFKIEFY